VRSITMKPGLNGTDVIKYKTTPFNRQKIKNNKISD